MLEGSQLEALSCLKDVRWPLLESYALARQEGLVDPVGLVIDATFPYAQTLSQSLLVVKDAGASTRRTTTCMERAVLCGVFATPAPDVAQALHRAKDEPGRWTAVILAQNGWVLTGTWQELFTLEVPKAGRASRQR
jgi:hypothetical protein